MLSDHVVIGADGAAWQEVKVWGIGPTDGADTVTAYCDRFQAVGHLMVMDADIHMVFGGGLGMESVLWFQELDLERDKVA